MLASEAMKGAAFTVTPAVRAQLRASRPAARTLLPRRLCALHLAALDVRVESLDAAMASLPAWGPAPAAITAAKPAAAFAALVAPHPVFTVDVLSAVQVRAAIAQAARESGLGASAVARVVNVVDELLANAQRATERAVVPMAPSVSWAVGATWFAVAVRDQVGALTAPNASSALHRAIGARGAPRPSAACGAPATLREDVVAGAPGAGLGLYLSAGHASWLWVCSEPGVATEVIALFPRGAVKRTHATTVR